MIVLVWRKSSFQMIQVELSTRNYKYEAGWKVERETELGVTGVCLIEQSLRCQIALRSLHSEKEASWGQNPGDVNVYVL